MSEIKELVQKIERANESYRTGNSIVTDEVYDSWIETLEEVEPNNTLLSKVGFLDNSENRKQKLPIVMGSMNKVKNVEDLNKWFKSKNIPKNTQLVLTPKFDGCSFCSNENTTEGYTRGNGIEGQRSDSHLVEIDGKKFKDNIYTYGEVIIRRDKFINKYSEEYANPRNMVAGALNRKEISDCLSDFDYIRYGLVSYSKSMYFNTKVEILDYLNKNQKVKVNYKVANIVDLTEDYLRDLYVEWNKEYEIDGIIIEIDDSKFCEELGREKNSNPSYARAFKGNFEECKTSIVQEIEYNISKKGYAIPRIRINPVELDGATVTHITGNNFKYINDMGIGVGSEILLKRSGMVIPFIIKTTKRVDVSFPELGHELKWDDNHVHLITVDETNEQRLQQLISFFKILEVDNVSEGIIKQLFENGYDTVKKILMMSKLDLYKLDRFGERKVEIVYEEIHSKMNNITLSKLQHASGKFENLGSKKLLLLESLENPTFNDICNVEGFSDISSHNYLDGINDFNEFLDDLGDLLSVKKTEKVVATGSGLKGLVFVFTGVRRKDLNITIENMGGRVASGVSSKITHLVMKAKGSGSSKEKKALDLGKEILTVEELEEMLGFN